ncbi:MAG: O-antigen ligase family protein [Sandaracinaceae bacterium]|nr:O-antigen ligase family protein [Sandaracinaceae bacterium]
MGVHVALAPLMLAGAFSWGLATSAVSSVILLFAVVLSDRARPLPWSPGMAALLALGAVTVLQTVPLPIALVQALSPLAADDALHVAAMLGDPAPSWVPLSRDPGRTRLSMLLGLNVICTVLALSLLVERQRPRGFMRAIALACSVVVVVSLGHAALGATTVFGVYQPVVGGRVFGPIINVNHLSAFAALTTLLCLGLGIQEEPGARKSMALFAATMAACLALLTTSRGGALSLLIATGIAVQLSRRAGARVEIVQKLVLGALVIAALVGLGLLLFRVRETQGLNDIERLDLLRRGGELALDHWIAGAGRGAFEPAFMYRSTFLARYTHPENILIQYGTEFGIPVTVLAIAWFARGTFSALRTSQTSAALGAGVLVMLFLHDLFDFALELPGVAVPAAACAGIAWTRAHAARKSAYYVWGIATLAALGVAALVVRLPVDDPATTRARLQAGSLSTAALAEIEREVATLHPADGLLTASLGHAYAERGSPRAGRWLNRSMYLAPEWAEPHRLAALWLVRMGRPDQALIEVREADRLHAGAGTPALCEVLARDADVEHIRRASVDAESLAETVARARACAGVSADFRVALDALLVAEGTDDFGAHARHLTAMARTQPSDARAAAEALRAAHPEDPAAIAVWMDILILVDPAAALAARDQPSLPDGTRWNLVRLASEARDREVVDDIVRVMRRDAAGQSSALAAIDARHGQVLVDIGHPEEGIALIRSSIDLDPSGPGAAILLQISVRDGRIGLARSASQHVCRQAGRESPQCQSAEQQVSRLTASSPRGLAPVPR